MKKMIVLLALSWGGFCMAQQPDSGTGTGSKADLFEKKHRVGIRKALNTGDSFWGEYAYRLGNRWHIGGAYSYDSSFGYTLLNVNNAPASITTKAHSVYVSGGYDIVKKNYLVLRAGLYLGWRWSRITNYYNGTNNSNGYDFRVVNFNDSVMVAAATLDALIPIMNRWEAGLSVMFPKPGETLSESTPSLLVTLMFKF